MTHERRERLSRSCLVAHGAEPLDRGRSEPWLDPEHMRRVVRRAAPADPSRRLDRRLRLHPEVHQVQQQLQVRLRLAVTAHRAQHDPRLTVPQQHSRDQRVHRALARLQPVGGIGVQRE